MANATPQHHLPQPSLNEGNAMIALVAITRRRLRTSWLITGLALLQVVVLGWLLLACLADITFVLSTPGRVAACVVFWLLLVASLCGAVLWPVVRPLPLRRVAGRIERAMPGMHNRLISVLDFFENNSPPQRDPAASMHPAFIARLLEQTRQRLANYRIELITPVARTRNSLLCATGMLMLCIGLFVLMPDRLPVAASRIFNPFAPIPPATWVMIQPMGDVQVLQGESVTIEARITRGSVASLDLLLRSDRGQWHRYPMQAEEGNLFTFTLDRVNQDYDYQVVTGRTWTQTHRIAVIERPRIDDITAHVHLPDYMRVDTPLRIEDTTQPIHVPRGSQVALLATVHGNAVAGQAHVSHVEQVSVEHRTDREIIWFDDDLPADATPQGNWQWTSDPVYSGRRSHTFGAAQQPYGFTTRLNRLAIEPQHSLFFYLKPDEQYPPRYLFLTFFINDAQHHAIWWSDQAEKAEPYERMLRSMDGVIVERGLLPQAGRWHRMALTWEDLFIEPADEKVAISGIRILVDGGRCWFDRFGALEHQTQLRRQRLVTEVGDLALQRSDEEANAVQVNHNNGISTWHVRVPVEHDSEVSLTLSNALGYVSERVQPVSIVAVEDQPPTVVMEQPARNLAMRDITLLPITGRAFDDWALDAAGVQVGRSEDNLDQTHWFKSFDQMTTSHEVTTMLNPHRYNLAPGSSLYYRLIVRDRKGQLGYSETFRLRLLTDAQTVQDDEEHLYDPQTRLPAAELARDLFEAMQSLMNLLRDHEALLDDMIDQQAELADQAEQARDDDDELARISEEQQAFDPDALEAMEQVRNWLTPSPLDEESLPSPWSSPQDADANGAADDDVTQDDAPSPDLAGDDPSQQQPAQPDDATAQDDAAEPDGQDAMSDALEDHQDQMQDQLTRHRDELQVTADRVQGLTDELAELLQQMADEDASPMDEDQQMPGDEVGETVGEGEGEQPGAGQVADAEQTEGQQRLGQLLQSSDMAQAMLLLQRMMPADMPMDGMGMDAMGDMPEDMAGAMAGQMSADTPGDFPGTGGGAGSIESDRLSALSPQQRAALYRLPPHWREPMLEALHAPGPEGYQPLIDAYFRTLSEQVQ